jgi:cytochrome c oxidase subunit 4
MSSQHGHHVIPKKVLYSVFGTLVFLTILTAVTAEYVDIGAFNVPLALAIAGSKAGLVVTFFMALKYDNKVNTLVFMFGTVFVVVFLTFTLFDTAFRGDLGNVGSETISDIEHRESMMRDREANLESQRLPSDNENAEDPSMEGSFDDEDAGAVADTTAVDTSTVNGEDADPASDSTDP